MVNDCIDTILNLTFQGHLIRTGVLVESILFPQVAPNRTTGKRYFSVFETRIHNERFRMTSESQGVKHHMHNFQL